MLAILSQNFMAEKVQAVPNDFAFEGRVFCPQLRKQTHMLGQLMRLGWRSMTPGLLHVSGSARETFYKLYPFAIHTPGGIPNCPPISWLPGHKVTSSLAKEAYSAVRSSCYEPQTYV